jgi:Zn-dependent M28 family amino/carboxypeptidase
MFAGIITACGGESPVQFDGGSAYEYAAAQVDFGPRFPGSEGHSSVQEWLQETLIALGWVVETQSFSHYGVDLTNYIARLPNNTSDAAPLLLGAHYDTRPQADQDPLQPENPVLGANDGASGVAVLLELARVLPSHRPDTPIWLVFFDGEDSGNLNGWDWIVGSTYFANQLEVELQGVVIVDMVGDRDLQLYYDRNSDQDLSFEIWAVAVDLGMDGFIQEYRHSMIDDHTPFNRLGIPASVIIDFDYPAWHTTQDNLDMISAESLEQVGQTLFTWIFQYVP